MISQRGGGGSDHLSPPLDPHMGTDIYVMMLLTFTNWIRHMGTDIYVMMLLTFTNWIRATPCAICKAGSLFWSNDRVAWITHIIGYITNAMATWCCDHTIGQVRWGWTLNCKSDQIFLRMEDSRGQDKQLI